MNADAAFDAANAAHQRGDLKQAEAGYRGVLAAQPGHAYALQMLGVLEAQRGNLKAALELLRKAAAADRGNAAVQGNLGNVLGGLGRQAEALEHFRQAAALDPEFADPHCNMGQALRELGRREEALASYQRAVELRPAFVEAHFHRACVLAELGRGEEALRGFDQVTSLRPGHVDAHLGHGHVLADQRRFAKALVSYDRAVAANPSASEALCYRSHALRELGHHADALESAERAIRIDAKSALGHCMRGLALSGLGRHADAIASLDRAIALQPKLAAAHNGRGNALFHLERHAEALASFERAIALQPELLSAQTNRGIVLGRTGRENEALEALNAVVAGHPDDVEARCARAEVLQDLKRHAEALQDLERAVALDPAHADAVWNECLCRLVLGDFERGWAHYDSRWRTNPDGGWISLRQPMWRGGPVAGTLLAWGEQGVGDQVQHLGMLDALDGVARRTVVAVDARLVPLVRRSFPQVSVVPREQVPREPCDAQVPLGNLGAHARKRWEDFPAGRRSYLVADEARARGLREQLSKDGRLVCGLSWASAARKLGADKSMALRDLAPLLGLEGVRFIDLQYGDTAAERRALKEATGIEVTRVEGVDNLADLDGLAALIRACDAVVTVSNTTAHLAGALGTPVHLMLPFSRGRLWYWHEGRDDSPWYPSVRIYRQAKAGDWGPVVAQVKAKLEQRPWP